MGFYGNITNTARTQFQFDKIYSNRYEMDNTFHLLLESQTFSMQLAQVQL